MLRPTVSPLTHARRSVTRKVPRPPQPSPRLSPIGSARILAPNSDISLSLSQSQSESQDESSQRSYLSKPSLSDGSMLRPSLLSNRVVYRERSPSRDSRKENLWVLPDNISDKADDEMDDNHSDYGSTHNSLFSGDPSDSENSTYDADHSSLEPIRLREGAFSQINHTVLREQQPSQSQNDHVSASMVVHPASSQQQSEKKLHVTPLEGSYGAGNGQRIQPINTTIGSEYILEAQIFNNHVNEMHSDLPVSTQPQISQTRVKRPFVTPANVGENPESLTQVHPPRKAHSPSISEIVSKTPFTNDQMAGMGDVQPMIRKLHTSMSSGFQRHTNVITHDAKAWIAPSFFRPSSSINIDGSSATFSRSATNLKDQSNSPAKRRNPGGLFENIVTNNQTPKWQTAFRGDQNSDPSAHINSPSLSNFNQSKSHNSSVKSGSFTTETSKLRKRARDSGRVSQTSSSCSHKKRKISYSPPINGQVSNAKSTPSDQKFNTKILGGWCHGLDRPVLLSTIDDPHAPSEEDVVTWHRLKDICLRIDRKREMESL
ncbi:hypothetical protein BDZ94DRAFT_823310 [Collybia nuda]|uniref:Uncharacterized protein n=1 Tax=Collybia nuda TaxID=64659 RepID=A0A9P5Y4S2_9AGAR|nr:hypothetical protein BDZ94DRAFT_823310 [Collybia nuda]